MEHFWEEGGGGRASARPEGSVRRKGVMTVLVAQVAAVYWVPTLCRPSCVTSLLGGPGIPVSQMGKGRKREVTSGPSCTSSGSRKPLGIPGKAIPPELRRPGHETLGMLRAGRAVSGRKCLNITALPSAAVGSHRDPGTRILYGFSFSSDFVVFLCLISPESHLESNLQTAGTPCAEGGGSTGGGAAGRAGGLCGCRSVC